VGEWSGALNPGSLKSSTDEYRDKKAFVEAQLELFENCCAGWFWWTYKKANSGDTGWSFRDAVEAGIFPSWVGMKATKSCISNAEEEAWQRRRDKARDKASSEHAAYWSQFPGKYEHWRFEDGFVTGWDDAYAFFSSSSHLQRPVPELGFKVSRRKQQLTEHVRVKGCGKCVWEYEHGFSRGVDDARRDFGQHYC